MPSSHKNSNLTLIHGLRVIVKWLSVAKQDTGMSEQQQRWFTPAEGSLHSCKTLKQLVTINADTRPLPNFK